MNAVIPKVKRDNGDVWRDFREWSIAIYGGDSPFTLTPIHAPVLQAKDVTDVDAEFIADPFMLFANGVWHMYFEVLLRESRKGVIAKAKSDDGINWQYQGVVLEEDFHLSYPFVFQQGSDFYMLPETLEANEIRLYKSKQPDGPFHLDSVLLEGSYADPTLINHGDTWFLFACSAPYQHNRLELFHSHSLTEGWQVHPDSPLIVDNKESARPAGRIFQYDQHLYRLNQDCAKRYGHKVRVNKILTLTDQVYREESIEQPLFTAAGNLNSSQWNGAGMHHADIHRTEDGRWIACVDGDNYRIPAHLLEQGELHGS